MTSNSLPGTALVTGASSGIGATYADRLARRGYDLILVARNRERLDAAAERLARDHGVKVDVLAADLTQHEDVLRVEARLRSDAAITMFVNNAGMGSGSALKDETDLDLLDRMVAVNVVAANRLAIAAVQAFLARDRGTIVNTASVVALSPHFFNGTYSASKSFVLTFTESLAGELQGTNVRLQAVLPGLTRTEIFERAGGSVDALDPEKVMDVSDLVDAALAGLDQGELITIPSLADAGLYDGYIAARDALGPHLSLRKPAARYGVTDAASDAA
ncbi:SDR family NAD(P)-dependent oxidoreductase [Rhizobium halophytocola]|uniref:Short-subunit dehydrogenase n=1 Tax=Rhizobium halophytocola TaxID=735519 RepID=A0ABS4DY76_9HYPH|nr:SDR family oxidoreductase [Rhizobium halophytocola]MBP1850644.1 short-subunit dehydrogenase [Rhizobium halophytocola]